MGKQTVAVPGTGGTQTQVVGGRRAWSRRDRERAAAVVHDVREDIGRPGAWCQGTMENMWDAHCILGQFDEERERTQSPMRRHSMEDIAMAEGYVQEHIRGGQGIVQFNDAWFRSQRQVVQALWNVEAELCPERHSGCLGSWAEHRSLAAIDQGVDDVPPPKWALAKYQEAGWGQHAPPALAPWRLVDLPNYRAHQPNQGAVGASSPGLDAVPAGQFRPTRYATTGQDRTPDFTLAGVELQDGDPELDVRVQRSRAGLAVERMREEPAIPVLGVVVIGGTWFLAPLLLVLTAVGLIVGGVVWHVGPVLLERWRASREDDVWEDVEEGDDDGGDLPATTTAPHDDPPDPAEVPVAPLAEPEPVPVVPEPREPMEYPEEPAAVWEPPAPADERDVVAPPSETRPRVESPVVVDAEWWPMEADQPETIQVESRWGLQVDGPVFDGLARQSNGELAHALPPGGHLGWMDRRIRESWMPGRDTGDRAYLVEGQVRRG